MRKFHIKKKTETKCELSEDKEATQSSMFTIRDIEESLYK